MLKAVIIGSGNVAQHLIKAFLNSKKIELVQVYTRNSEAVTHLLASNKITNSLNSISEADIYIIAVSDDAIADISLKLPFTDRLVVHTSGSVALEQLDTKNRRGVFYPLQTFSKNKEVDFSKIPLCLESEQSNDYKILEETAKAISPLLYTIDSRQRQSLHVAAVFVNNFTNHMYTIGNQICNKNAIPFDILRPLIQETAAKIELLTPLEAQTGPAKRKDEKTIEKHLKFLKDDNQKAIYTLLTQSIQKTDV
ncbi:NADP oxidoreductase coenzyme F420-dependent [compost metagenome]